MSALRPQSPAAHTSLVIQDRPGDGTLSGQGQPRIAHQTCRALTDPSPAPILAASPRPPSVSDSLSRDQEVDPAQEINVSAESSPTEAIVAPSPTLDAPRSDPPPPAGSIGVSPPRRCAPRLEDDLLRIFADNLDGIEDLRITMQNRTGALWRGVKAEIAEAEGRDVSDEEVTALAERNSDYLLLLAQVEGMQALEKEAVKNLQSAMKRHYLGPWVARSVGVGLKQGARLIAAIGDPSWHSVHDRPRTLGELWAYCGYHVIDGQAPRRRRGAKANWNGDARKRAWLVATSCMKSPASPYRLIYERVRKEQDEAIHLHPCAQCGTKTTAKKAGQPAPVGSPLRPGHQHARALRIVSKEVLRDMWLAAREVRGL